MKRFAFIALWLLVFAAAYYGAALLGLAFRFQGTQISVVWPANGVFLAAMLLAPRQRRWMVLVVAAATHMVAMGGSVPVWRLAWQMATNFALVISAVELLRHFAGLPLRLASRRQVLAFIGAAFVLPAVIACSTPAFVRAVLGLESAFEPFAILWRAALSNTTSLLLVTPAVLLWAQQDLRRFRQVPVRQAYEAGIVMMWLLGVALIVLDAGPELAHLPALLLWIVPPLMWAAVRLGPLGTSTSLFLVAALSVFGTAQTLGPFVHASATEQVLSLQLFWILLCLPFMLLAAVIRERDQAEAALLAQRNQLAHVTRVATVGTLSGVLAHELNQPLMAIMANAQAGIHLLARETLDPVELQQILQDIAKQDQQAADVIARLRMFMREGTAGFEPVRIEPVVRDALAIGHSAIAASGVDVQTHIAAGLPLVHGDAVQILQVVLNLVVNGCEAMHTCPRPERRLRLHVVPVDGHVDIAVTDRGVGLPAGLEHRLFDPFFTTKDAGLGLGLAISRSIATAHGGRLQARNNPDGGATFELRLPVAGVGRDRRMDN
jgi:signal transduction histidine kinase